MERLDMYLSDRKTALLRFGKRFGLDGACSSAGSLPSYYAQLKKSAIDLNLPVMTNIENELFSYFDLKIYSRYQRQGHFIKNDNLFNELYGDGFKPKPAQDLFFTANCQSVHYALFHVLQLLFPNANIVKPTEKLYFESNYILERFEKILNAKDADHNIVFLDSSFMTSKSELFFFEEVKECPLIIFDTTCYDRQSEYISEVVRRAQMKEIPLILTRSHLKLDSLGTEYGPLGSIMFLNEKDNSIKNKCYEYISHMGSFANVLQIYPFIFDQDIKDIATMRNQMIQSNTEQIHQAVMKDSYEYGFYQPKRLHGLFNVFVYEREKINFYKVAEKFVALSKVFNIDSKFCDSFGFDFFSLTNVESEDAQQRGFLRFCSSINKGDVEKSVKVINSVVKQIEEAPL